MYAGLDRQNDRQTVRQSASQSGGQRREQATVPRKENFFNAKPRPAACPPRSGICRDHCISHIPYENARKASQRPAPSCPSATSAACPLIIVPSPQNGALCQASMMLACIMLASKWRRFHQASTTKSCAPVLVGQVQPPTSTAAAAATVPCRGAASAACAATAANRRSRAVPTNLGPRSRAPAAPRGMSAETLPLRHARTRRSELPGMVPWSFWPRAAIARAVSAMATITGPVGSAPRQVCSSLGPCMSYPASRHPLSPAPPLPPPPPPPSQSPAAAPWSAAAPPAAPREQAVQPLQRTCGESQQQWQRCRGPPDCGNGILTP